MKQICRVDVSLHSDTLFWFRANQSALPCAVWLGATSDTVPVISGVPQGTVLGPLLFLIFINDLPNCVQSRIRLFADDCILYGNIRSNEDTIVLQDDLNKLADWEQKWGMDFHPDKCSTLHVTRSKKKYYKTTFSKDTN